MITLFLLRHGTTQANLEGAFIGHLESPLSQRGKEEVRALCNCLKEKGIQHFFSSPSKRAYETIAPLAKRQASRVHLDESLKEIHFGKFEGKTYKDIKRYHPEALSRMLKEGNAYKYPEGESLLEAHKRVSKGLKAILERVEENQKIAICAHGGTIRCILSELISKDAHLHWHFKIDPASITVVTLDQGFAVIEKLNDTSHLLGCSREEKRCTIQ